MNNDTRQQILYLDLFMTNWFNRGSSLWDCYNVESPACVEINGTKLSTEELLSYAAESKRNANYANALGALIQSIDALKCRKVPVKFVYELFCVLVSVNEYYRAFSLLGTVLSDMQQSAPGCEATKKFEQEYLLLMRQAVLVVDDNDFSELFPYTMRMAQSEKYRYEKTLVDIKNDMREVRETIRKVFGQ